MTQAQLTEGRRFGKLVTGILDKLETKYGGQLVSKVRADRLGWGWQAQNKSLQFCYRFVAWA